MKLKTKRKKIRNPSSSSQSNDMESSDLRLEVVKIAVAQICNSVGYTGAQTSALETLTAVAIKYLQSLATSAAISANSTGRTQCNLLDIICALEDLHSDLGFNGNSDRRRRLYILSDSSILIDMMKFVYLTPEIPFAKPLPRRSHTLPPNSPCFSGESAHIPRWLPDFPKIADVGEKTVNFPAQSKDETAWQKKFVTIESNRKISKLPEKRKKVSFTIGGNGGKNVIKMKSEVDLRGWFCKGEKRISCQIPDDNTIKRLSVDVDPCPDPSFMVQPELDDDEDDDVPRPVERKKSKSVTSGSRITSITPKTSITT